MPILIYRGDTRLTAMSDMNNFLFNIQKNMFPGGPKYAVYGDSTFREVQTCTFSRHVPQHGVPLTSFQ